MGVVTRVGLFAGWPELIITDGYQPVNSDTPLRALFLYVCTLSELEPQRFLPSRVYNRGATLVECFP